MDRAGTNPGEADDGPPLSRNEHLVLGAHIAAGAPQTAYQLLDSLRGDGLKAPLQIYRALRTLGERGKVHRLDSLNAFVPCAHGHEGHGHAAIFAICRVCGRADELSSGALDAELEALARPSGFAAEESLVEIRGRCRQCAEGLPR